MSDLKQEMEEECLALQQNLKQLTDDRNALRNEFASLNEMHRELMVQLKEDTLAGEGKLHTFYTEQMRIEDRLEQLEKELAEKNERMAELDAKASDYLLSVTTASNSIYDGSDQEDQDNTQNDLIQQLVYEDMVEHNEVGIEAVDNSKTSSSIEVSESSTENVSLNAPPINETTSKSIVNEKSALDEDKLGRESEIVPPTTEQMLSLSSLVSEFKMLKEEMGRCIFAKEGSFLDLEERLQDTKKELSYLRGSVSDMSLVGFKKVGYPSSEGGTSLDCGSICYDENHEKLSSINKTNVDITDDYLPLTNEGVSDSGENSGQSSSNSLKQFRSSSTCSISGCVAVLEKDLNDANNKLTNSRRRMRYLLNEREHKQKECELLQKKVQEVESKMCELQKTFDALVKAMMSERDDIVKDVNNKETRIEEMQKELNVRPLIDLSLYIDKEEFKCSMSALEESYNGKLKLRECELNDLKITHCHEVEKLNKELSNSIVSANQAMEHLKSQISKLESNCREHTALIDHLKQQRDFDIFEIKTKLEDEQILKKKLEEDIDTKNKENLKLMQSVESMKSEISCFVPHMQEEMNRLKEENLKLTDDRNALQKTFEELQEEHKLLEKRNKDLVNKSDSSRKEKTAVDNNLESLKEELAEQIEKLADSNLSNQELRKQMKEKSEEYEEELKAREATIQELRVTLTNNQRQSCENYRMLQGDMTEFQAKVEQEREENQAIISHLKNKVILNEEETEKLRQELREINIFPIQDSPDSSERDCNEELELISADNKSSLLDAKNTNVSILAGGIEEYLDDDSDGQAPETAAASHAGEEKQKLSTNEENYKTKFEQQMEQIRKLNLFIDNLKLNVKDVSEESSRLKQTVRQLSKEKEDIDKEKDSLIKELDLVKNSSRSLENDLETKKKLG